jgi:hypothetical protein
LLCLTTTTNYKEIVMRQIHQKTKLRLGRETVAVLQSVELNEVNGGIMYTGCISGCTKCPGDVQPQPDTKPPVNLPTAPNWPLPGLDTFKTFQPR